MCVRQTDRQTDADTHPPFLFISKRSACDLIILFCLFSVCCVAEKPPLHEKKTTRRRRRGRAEKKREIETDSKRARDEKEREREREKGRGEGEEKKALLLQLLSLFNLIMSGGILTPFDD